MMNGRKERKMINLIKALRLYTHMDLLQKGGSYFITSSFIIGAKEELRAVRTSLVPRDLIG